VLAAGGVEEKPQSSRLVNLIGLSAVDKFPFALRDVACWMGW
jgi:hypothetical protein